MEKLIDFNKILNCYKYRKDGLYDLSLKDSEVTYDYILHRCEYTIFTFKEFYTYEDNTYYYLIRKSYFDRIKKELQQDGKVN